MYVYVKYALGSFRGKGPGGGKPSGVAPFMFGRKAGQRVTLGLTAPTPIDGDALVDRLLNPWQAQPSDCRALTRTAQPDDVGRKAPYIDAA